MLGEQSAAGVKVFLDAAADIFHHGELVLFESAAHVPDDALARILNQVGINLALGLAEGDHTDLHRRQCEFGALRFVPLGQFRQEIRVGDVQLQVEGPGTIEVGYCRSKTVDSYIRLGQPATTLSGGEAQRVKLATELSKRATGKTVYLLDEPTTGLSFEDCAALLGVLHRLVDAGNTVILIEHNIDVMKNADWLIDLGPGAGDKGGDLIATGTPEQLAGPRQQRHRAVSESRAGAVPRLCRAAPASRSNGRVRCLLPDLRIRSRGFPRAPNNRSHICVKGIAGRRLSNYGAFS